MDLKLEVVLSSSIKRKKPWPRFCWLGLEKESVFLLDDKRISEINMVSGRTKKKTPKLHPVLPRVVTMAASQNGVWLAGLLVSGEMFLWNKDKDLLKTVAGVPTVAQLITEAQGSGVRLSLVVSDNGMRAMLVVLSGKVFLWECVDLRDLNTVRDGLAKGRWAQIQHPEHISLPSPKDKETSQHSIFIKGEAVGDVCLSAFVFTVGLDLSVTFLKIQWDEGQKNSINHVGYSVHWVNKTYPMSHLTPPCVPVRSRGALLPAFSPDGLLLAVVLNQREPRANQVLFISTQNFVTVCSGLGGCGSKELKIPSKYVRSYWVASVSWAAGGLYLACVLKRGSLVMLVRLGGLLSLSTSGCNVDFGPAHFLPLHPLVTYRPPVSLGGAGVDPLSSSSLSARDILRQRYSVTWHPRLPYLIVSDGYMATVLRASELPSPATLLRALLHKTSQGLDSASRELERKQPNARAWLESMSCPKVGISLKDLRTRPRPDPTPTATAASSLPLFLQDQGGLGETRELIERVQALFEDDSDLEGPPVGSHAEDGGRLEFASMFDTQHALPDTLVDRGPHPDPDASSAKSEGRHPALTPELRVVRGCLLTAWGLAVSLGDAVEQREQMLMFTAHCAVRLVAVLRLTTGSHPGRTKKRTAAPFSSLLLHLLGNLLSFLPWDGPHTGGRSGLGAAVELTGQLVGLLLSSPPGQSSSKASSQTLSTALRLLQLVSQTLDHTYSLRQKHPGADVYEVTFLKEDCGPLEDVPPPQRPSSRLRGAWRVVYQHTLQCWEELKYHGSTSGCGEEEGRMSVILSQIQTALQGMGDHLGEGPALRSYTGEQHFLFGCYTESAQAWRAGLWAEIERDGPRGVFLQTRLCLSLLYGLLFCYRLREAQSLGDHMARVLLRRVETQREHKLQNMEDVSVWLPADVHSEAACAVVQTLGRFMASYFTNQPLLILPPHSVDVLPPVHLPHSVGGGRLVPLCQEAVSGAVRGQQLSEVWTVGYTQDLLLLGGLLPEATWLAHHLGDWKTAASLGLAYTSYSTDQHPFTSLRWRELHLPAALKPESIFQGQLESLLGRKAGPEQTHAGEENYKSFTGALMEGEDMEFMQASVQDILKASVLAGVDVLSQPLRSLLDSAKDLTACLPALVPVGLYLPAPPLYCPQPAPNTQDRSGVFGHQLEEASRHGVSELLQTVLLLLRSARCTLPAAQWYIRHLRHSRHILDKIHQKYSQQQQKEAKVFPESLVKLASRRGFFSGGGTLDPITVQTITCFRELCGLCWMLHVRDQLSMSCRKYQAARNCGKNAQVPADDSEVTAAREEALRWACRFLPFSRFLNAEEILQDTLLSLVSEVPHVFLVAETLVQAFPEEVESVRVPLREKYSSLLESLRQHGVSASGQNCQESHEEEGEETMIIVMQERLRQRRKDLKRLARHLAPMELYLWEREEDERGGGGQGGVTTLGRFSSGASLSNSTLTECGRPLVYSDGDTAENSEALSVDGRPPHSINKRAKALAGAHESGRKEVQMGKSVQDECRHRAGPAQDPAVGESPGPSLPVVGTWEFELEDEGYLRFLDLFLSYVLERHGPDPESSCDPPLLKCFCSQLREKELHSLSFDVLTTLRRRQRDGRHVMRRQGGDVPVFRAGQCFSSELVTALEPPPSFLQSEPLTLRPSMPAGILSLPGLGTGKQRGLFGLWKQASPAPEATPQRGRLGLKPSPSQSSEPWVWPSGPRASVEVVELQQEIDPKLEAQFPLLGRLLEWMVRWADKRAPLGQSSRKKEREAGRGGAAGGGVGIRVKVSAPAVLTALNMLGQRYSTVLLGGDRYRSPLQAPESQWTVAPVLQAEAGWKLERESSVDTGYPASAGTPVTLPDQEPPHSQLSYGSQVEGVEPVISQMTSHDHEVVTFNTESRVADVPGSKRDFSTENENPSSDEEALMTSAPNISVHIQSLFQTSSPHHQALTLADLQGPETEDDIGSSQEDEEHLPSCGSLRKPPTDIPKDLTNIRVPSDDPEWSSSSPARLKSLPTAGPQVGAQIADTARDVKLPERSTNATQTTASSSNQNLPPQTDSFRHLLQDELFNLVQLQQINFMSLMQVVGTSFINLPHLQNNLPQSTALPPHPNPSMPQTGVLGPQSSAQATPASEPPPGVGRLTGHPHIQEIQPIAVNHEPLRDPPGATRNLIPPSHGLLTTVDLAPLTSSAHVLLPPGGSTEHHPPYSSGLRLLSLGRPGHVAPIREACGPSSERRPSTLGRPHLNLGLCDPATLRRTEEEERQWERGSSAPPPHLNLTQYAHQHPPEQPPRSTRPQTTAARAETSRWAETLHLPPAFRPPPVHGLPLLRFHPDPRPLITFPRTPLPLSSIPLTITPAAVDLRPRLPLLRRDPEPPRMVPPNVAPPPPTPRLIPPEELPGQARGVPRGAVPRLHLLRADTQTQNHVPPTPSADTPPSRRRKRREGLPKEGGRAEVTFRPEDSIIPPQEPREEEPTESVPGNGFVFPLGTFDSMLTGQGLLDQARSTSAQLHAFASTCKIPPESQDACTNTDPATPPSDKGTPAKTAVDTSGSPALPPELFLNLRFPRERPFQEAENPLESPGGTGTERNMREQGRHFISVVDLERAALLQEFPSCLRPGVLNQDTPPSSAQLHLLAASVTNAGPPKHAADASTGDEPLKPEPGFSMSSPQPAQPVPSGDPVTLSLLQEKRSPGRVVETKNPAAHGGALSRAPGIQVTARLSEMDAQLAALQDIADHMEREFANTRLLVRTIETLGPAVAPKVIERTTNKTVTLNVSPKGETPRLFVHHDSELREEERQQEEELEGSLVSCAPLGVKQPIHPPSSVSQITSSLQPPTPTGLRFPPDRPEAEQSVWDISQDLTENMDRSPKQWAEETLGLSGLSDVADILGELVTEGGISPTAIGLSQTQAAHFRSRLVQQESGRAGQHGVRAEEERRELRVWMRRKQRERLVEYRRQRDEKRLSERKPFLAPAELKPTSKYINANKKTKEEKDKVLLLEHHAQRTRDACSLITDLLTTPVIMPTNANRTLTLPSPRPTSKRPITAQSVGSARSSHRGRSVSVGGKWRAVPKLQTARAHSSPGVISLAQRLPVYSADQEARSTRLGLYRPATALPGDRLSQVTRRGMITTMKSRSAAGPKTPRQTELRQDVSKSPPRRGDVSQSPPGRRRDVSQSPPGWRSGRVREQREIVEREQEVVSPWNPSPEIRKLLGLESSDSQSGAATRGAGLDVLDTLSESTGSILSKLDWAAIESIVAAEGAI
ncbi:hypothetical protein UPYG_G00284190 [Umbra pygmaea]|uniref:Ciliogenesis and planar polarity effector 1 n=1 Tax=Umbra pygmaea TaxID=75934 RepID=A0ABD0WSS8_UMBPY